MIDPAKHRKLRNGMIVRVVPGTKRIATLDGVVRWGHAVSVNLDAATRMCIGPQDVVLDLGANIGAFSRWAAQRGAARVIAVEPVPSNCELLIANTEGMPVQVLPGAVVPVSYQSDAVSINLYDDDPFLFCSSFKPRGKRRRIVEVLEVLAYRVDELMRGCTVVKVDVEGAEFDLDIPAHVPDSVRQLSLDFHRNKDFDWRDAVQRIHDGMVAKGFRQTQFPSFEWLRLSTEVYVR